MRWAALLLLLLTGTPAVAAPVVVSAAPTRVAVSLYRDPDRRSDDAIDRDDPRGFAVIAETRRVTLPRGPVTIRFEGVASGILPQTAIVVGPAVREKNRDARLLSQRGLLDAFTGQALTLRRTDRATGRVTVERAILRSDAESLVIQTARGIEAVKCSGLNQTLLAPRVPAGLSAKPVLSVLTRDQPGGTVEVTLTYVATRFDWQANYVGALTPDGRHLDLLGWLTMASADDTSFPDAAAGAIAGRVAKVDREDEDRDDEREAPLSFTCWPSDTTSTGLAPPPSPPPPPAPPAPVASCPGDCEDIVVTGSLVRREFSAATIAVTAVQENVGDLKLFRIPVPVTVAARAQKQVAFLVQRRVPGALVHRVRMDGGSASDPERVYLMRNTAAGGLGRALPTGRWTLYQQASTGRALVGQASLPDRTEGEDLELVLGGSSVGVDVTGKGHDRYRLVATNPTPDAVTLRLEFPTGDYRYDGLPVAERKPGKSIVVLGVPANGTASLDYRATEQDE